MELKKAGNAIVVDVLAAILCSYLIVIKLKVTKNSIDLLYNILYNT